MIYPHLTTSQRVKLLIAQTTFRPVTHHCDCQSSMVRTIQTTTLVTLTVTVVSLSVPDSVVSVTVTVIVSVILSSQLTVTVKVTYQ